MTFTRDYVRFQLIVVNNNERAVLNELSDAVKEYLYDRQCDDTHCYECGAYEDDKCHLSHLYKELDWFIKHLR